MHDRARARAWRAAAGVLAGAWVVLACGGADEEAASRAASAGTALHGAGPAGTARVADARAAAGVAPAQAAAPAAVPPCAAVDIGAQKKAALQAGVEAEFEAVIRSAAAQEAGTVDAADPFEER